MRLPALIRLPALVLLLAACTGGPARAQGPAPPAEAPAALLITDVDLEGNTAFDETLLLLTIRTRANRTFLGVPGFRLWVWLYNLGDRGCCLTDGVARAFKASGEPPAYLDPQLLDADVERLTLLYRQEGFRSAEVDTRIDTLGEGKVRVTFDIDEGPPTHVRTLRYDGIVGLTDAQREALLDDSALDPGQAVDSSGWTFRPRDLRFAETSLRAERAHLLAFLRDEGYPQVTRDSIRAFVTPVSPDSFDVTLRVHTGQRLRFGDVSFYVTGPESTPPRTDTLAVPDAVAGEAEAIVTIEDERRLRARTLTRALQFRPGEWFNQTRLVGTKQRLEGTGLFVFSDFLPQWGEVRHTADGSRLPYRIELRTHDRHQIRWEFFMLSRDPVLGDDTGNEEIGVGVGTSYRNANLFGTGEIFQIRGSGSLAAAVRSTNPLNTAQAELETSLTLPYLIGPFRRLDRAFGLYDARSRIGLRLLTARREELRLIIRGRAAFQTGLELRHTPTLTSVINLVDFNLSDPDTLSGFSDRFLRFVDDPVERERILEDYSRPQVNNALRYTVRASTTNLFRRDQGYIREGSVEIGGNLPYLLDRFVFTPDVVEGSVPGLPFFRRGNAEGSRLIYRQYVRLLVDWRRYRPVTPRSVFAWKAIAGWTHPIGRAPVVPFDRRFYSGGPSSVRGWGLRALGPGAVARRTTDSFIQGGEIKLEASAESRTLLLRNVVAANWLSALFVDAGNVWYGPRNPGDPAGRFRPVRALGQVGVGSGVGLRIAWEYLIVRFDLAFKMHDPVAGFLPDGFGSPRAHFGIGQAF